MHLYLYLISATLHKVMGGNVHPDYLSIGQHLVPSGKNTWRRKIHPLQMNLVLNMWKFYCHDTWAGNAVASPYVRLLHGVSILAVHVFVKVKVRKGTSQSIRQWFHKGYQDHSIAFIGINLTTWVSWRNLSHSYFPSKSFILGCQRGARQTWETQQCNAVSLNQLIIHRDVWRNEVSMTTPDSTVVGGCQFLQLGHVSFRYTLGK